jgi:hypothetical protein
MACMNTLFDHYRFYLEEASSKFICGSGKTTLAHNPLSPTKIMRRSLEEGLFKLHGQFSLGMKAMEVV